MCIAVGRSRDRIILTSNSAQVLPDDDGATDKHGDPFLDPVAGFAELHIDEANAEQLIQRLTVQLKALREDKEA